MKKNLHLSTLSVSAFALLATSAAHAMTCDILNSDPMSFSGHASTQVQLSDRDANGNRSVTLGNGAEIEVAVASDRGAEVIYEAVDKRQPVRVTTQRVGNVEIQAIVTVGQVLPVSYSCRVSN